MRDMPTMPDEPIYVVAVRKERKSRLVSIPRHLLHRLNWPARAYVSMQCNTDQSLTLRLVEVHPRAQ